MFKGFDVSALPAQFQNFIPGRTLIIDGDGPAYVAAATAKTVPTAVRNYQKRILELMFMARAEDAIIHLTANTSRKAGRFLVKAAKPYQGNRTGKAKPPLLEAVRQAVALEENWLPEYRVEMHYEYEADDAMNMDAHRLGERGCIQSDDKDLRMTPFPYYDGKTGEVEASVGFGYVKMGYTPAGSAKPLGHGRKFFWWQLLMGDQADNIAGLRSLNGDLCGAVRSLEYICRIECEHACANAVLDAYRKINQNPLPEATLLWLLRWPGDKVQDYMHSLALSPENKRYLQECEIRDWITRDQGPAESDTDSGSPAGGSLACDPIDPNGGRSGGSPPEAAPQFDAAVHSEAAEPAGRGVPAVP